MDQICYVSLCSTWLLDESFWFQGMSFLWEQYEQQEQRMYHLHRSYAGISLAIARLLLAAIYMSHLRNVISSERSALKRDFYNSFTKVSYSQLTDGFINSFVFS